MMQQCVTAIMPTNPRLLTQPSLLPPAPGVLVLFGLIPVAMVWSERYARPPTTLSRTEIVPGGQLVLLAVGGSAAAIIGRELLLSITQRL